MNELLSKLKQINKEHTIVRLAKDIGDIERIPTGVASLDKAFGGWPMGRVVVLYGPYMSTKSTLALIAIAQAQQAGKQCVYVDSEKSFDVAWARKWGVDVDTLPVVETKNLEHIKTSLRPLMEGGADMVVIDSISSIQSEKFFEEENNAIGQQAKVTKELLSKIEYWNPNALIMCISQQTTKIEQSYTKQVPTGGNYFDHVASLIIKLNITKSDIISGSEKSKGKKIIESDFVAVDVHWFLEKSRFSKPYMRGMYRFNPDTGVDNMYEVLKMAELYEVLDVKGSWYDYGDLLHIQGFASVYNECESNPELYERIKSDVARVST